MTDQDLLFVGNYRGGDVSIVDMSSLKVIDTFDMGLASDGSAIQADSFKVSPDLSTLYLSRFPTSEPGPGVLKQPGDVAAYDVESREMKWKLDLQFQPNHIELSPDGSLIYVPIRDRNYIEVVDVASQEVVSRAPCGWGPHGTELTPDGRLLFVGTMWEDTLDVIDTATLELLTSVPLGEAVRPFQVTVDGATAYVQLSKLNGFKVVDVGAARVRATVDMPPSGRPLAASRTRWPYNINHGMRIDEDRSLLYCAGTIGDVLVVFSLPSLEQVAVVPVASAPAYVVLSEDRKVCIVACRDDDTISFVDTTTFEETDRLTVGIYPNRMAYVPASLPSR